jgi:isoleucyl-tRNA synthetase
MAREIINRVQNIRKESGLEITDHVKVTLAPNEQIEAAIASFADYIKGQVLADEIAIAPNNGVESEFDEFKLNILIEKQ